MGGGVRWSSRIVLLLTYASASSTATAGWVNGVEVIPLVALGGALLMAGLAGLPVPWPASLGLGFVLRPIVALVASGPARPPGPPPPPAPVRAAVAAVATASVP